MIAGLLPALARDLNVGLAAAGHLVTAFSLAYAIGAPVIAVLTAGLERRRLLAVAMGGFSLANLLAALAPGYAGLLAARLLLALSAATFMPAASGYAVALGGPERRGRALSAVTTGLTLAIIAGVPLGVVVGQWFGWRATFLGVVGLAAFSLPMIIAQLPRQPPGVTPGWVSVWRLPSAAIPGGAGDQRADRGRHLHCLHLSRCLHSQRRRSRPAGAGAGTAGLRPGQCGRHPAQRQGGGPLGRARTVIVGGGLALLAYLAFSLSAALGPARATPVMLPAILLWGLASWGLITAQQARLVALSPALALVSLSMNSSAIYLGSAMGAAAGALVVADGAPAHLGWVAAGSVWPRCCRCCSAAATHQAEDDGGVYVALLENK